METNNRRRLIVNGDDFGLSPGVNDGIALAHEQGILTSASLMVRWPAASEAATYARAHPNLSVGLHLDLGEWTFENEAWHMAYQVVPVEDKMAAAGEIERQLREFKRLIGHEPTHLDSHQHVHESEPVRSLCLAAARERGIILRNTDNRVFYRGDFYGQSNKGYPYPDGISVTGLVQVLKDLAFGVTELGCHPAKRADMQGMYCTERIQECDTLCHPDIRAAISAEGITLCSFLNWQG